MDELHNEEVEQEEQEKQTEESPRDISKLLGLSYSEMTEEEIDIVVNYKVNQEVESQEYKDKIQILQNQTDTEIEILKEKAQQDSDFLMELTRHAIGRFESEN